MRYKIFSIFFIVMMSGCVARVPLEQALNTVVPSDNNKSLAKNINFPAKIALLAYSNKPVNAEEQKKDWLIALVDEADNTGEISKINITKDQFSKELSAIFVTRDCKNNPVDNEEIRAKVINLAIDGGLKKMAVSPDELREVADIIKSGQFYRDISSSVISVANVVPKLANKLITKPQRVSTRFKETYDAIVNDFKDNPSAIECMRNLRAKEQCEKPTVLQHTLTRVYAKPTVEITRETMGILLEKKSIRLAVILYARSNGIDIDQEDINAVQAILADPNPELGGLYVLAINRMVKKYGLDEAKIKLEAMGENSSCTSA